jgi:hypothetical protein
VLLLMLLLMLLLLFLLNQTKLLLSFVAAGAARHGVLHVLCQASA